jgi:hypothetical protein
MSLRAAVFKSEFFFFFSAELYIPPLRLNAWENVFLNGQTLSRAPTF